MPNSRRQPQKNLTYTRVIWLDKSVRFDKKDNNDMNKLLYSILILGLSILPSFGQKLTLQTIENENGDEVQCYKDDNGNIEYRVYYIGSIADKYSGGLRRIEKDNKIGFIDKKGKVIIVPQYGSAEKFSKKRCAVRDLGKALDKSATDGSAEIIWEEGLWGIIDKKGTIVKPFSYERRWNSQEECYEYYNANDHFLFTKKGKIKSL